MIANELYNLLEEDFDLKSCIDSWELKYADYVSDGFKNRSMGLVFDNTVIVNKVYTAVFPSYDILDKLLVSGEQDILLFTHHPQLWDIKKIPAFIDISENYIKKLQLGRISMYTLHSPLDKNGPYSTSVNLANRLAIKINEEFCEYDGVKVGVIGFTDLKQVTTLQGRVRDIVGHDAKLYLYGDDIIRDSKVALIAGGGCISKILSELQDKGIDTFITGVTRVNEAYEPSVIFHNKAQELEINILGATHYSTEKYACIEIVEYFNNLGLEAEFLDGIYDLEDL
jgi:putative NIF3 family GTP cyclohydrolase 1 type 2